MSGPQDVGICVGSLNINGIKDVSQAAENPRAVEVIRPGIVWCWVSALGRNMRNC